MGNLKKWLYPGLGIKRWVFILCCGAFVFGMGLVLLAGPGLVWRWGAQVLKYFYQITGISAQVGGVVLLVMGSFLLFLGGYKVFHSLMGLFLPREEGKVVDLLYRRRLLQRGPHLVVMGGGTGLSVLLRGLKEYSSNITAVVNVCDDGGSSGRLRGEMGILPPGDIRNCLLALADTEPVMEKLFQHRFATGGELSGHNFGNLFIAAMSQQMGFQAAIKEFSKVLAVRGQVLPVTLKEVTLVAELMDGRELLGQFAVSQSPVPIKRVRLDPRDCQPLPEVLEAIDGADAIILGPGSLYTSIIPNLLVPGIREALAAARGKKYYICNVMTQPGETTGFSASTHLAALEEYVGPGVLEYFVVNDALDIPPWLAKRYREEGAKLVLPDVESSNKIKVIKAPLVAGQNLIRHDAHRLGSVIMEDLMKGDTPLHNTSHIALQILSHSTLSKGRERD